MSCKSNSKINSNRKWFDKVARVRIIAIVPRAIIQIIRRSIIWVANRSMLTPTDYRLSEAGTIRWSTWWCWSRREKRVRTHWRMCQDFRMRRKGICQMILSSLSRKRWMEGKRCWSHRLPLKDRALRDRLPRDKAPKDRTIHMISLS